MICQDCFKETNRNRRVCTTCLDQRIFDVITDYQPCSRDEMVRVTTMARSSVFDALVRLEEQGLVKKQSRPMKRGRPMIEWVIA